MKHIALNGSSGVAWLRRSPWLRIFLVASLSPGLLLWNSPVLANPRGGSVVHGDVTIGAGTDRNLQIRQNSPSAIINWESFSIDSGELTQFRQPNRSSAVLNRVTGGDPSAIHGAIKANGNVFVINPNGILVGAGGTIDVHGLVLSTLDVDNGEFLARGDMVFKGASGQGVNNLGRVNAIGGDVFLIGKTVSNSGTVSASQGTVGLAAGEEVLLTAVESGAGERIFVQAKGSGVSGPGIYNDGTIEGAAVEMKAHGNIYALAINNKGSVRATGATSSGGRVFLNGAGGTVSNSGSIRATTSGSGAAGRVLIEAAYARVDGRIQASGGSVRIAASERAEVGGTVDVSSRTGRGGEVVVEARDIEVGSEAIVDSSGESGGGSIRIGGGFQGRDPGVANADSLVVHQGASLRADSLGSGAAGQVILWSDGMTAFEGNISAQALGSSGDGGFVEVSGQKSLIYDGRVSTESRHGATGTLLLDPENLEIGSGTTTVNYLNTANLVSALAANQVVVSTGSATLAGQTGTMTVSSAVTWATGNQLALLAHGDIRFNASVQNTSTGSLIAIAGWDGMNGHTASSPSGPITGTLNFANFAANPAWYGNSNGSATGTIYVGNGSQGSNIAVGSRFGLTQVAASRLDLLAASGAAQLGYLAPTNGSATGNIEVRTGAGGVNLLAGAGATVGWAQIGHGGGVNINNVTLGGDVSVVTAGNVRVDASGTGSLAYAQIGMGALGGYGDITGTSPLSVRVIANGSVTLTGGNGTNRSAHIGQGGNGRDGNIVNGGVEVVGSAITLAGGTATSSNAHIGSGGGQTPGNNTGEGLISGDVIVVARSGNITLTGSGARSFAQIGHGGSFFNSALTYPPGLLAGNVHVTAEAGSITLAGGSGADAYAMIGHGADNSSKGTREGGIHVFAKGTITATDGAGANSGAHLIHRSGTGLSAADYLGGNGFRLLSNTTGTYSNRSLAGAGVMANANFGSGPVSFAFSNNIDIAIAGGSQLNVNNSDNLLMLTGGSLVLERGYQNSGDGEVVLVAGWNGVGTFSGGSSSHTAGGLPVIVAPDVDFDSITGFGQNSKALTIGNTTQTVAVAVGSRAGLNALAGYGLVLHGSNVTGNAFSQVGFFGNGSGDMTGNLRIRLLGGGLNLSGGTASSAYAQIGHGGVGVIAPGNIDAKIDIAITGPGDVMLTSRHGSGYAQIGHGGRSATQNRVGSISLTGFNNLSLGGTNGNAQIGHGGNAAAGNSLASDIIVTGTGDISLGGGGAYVMVGHGGINAPGSNARSGSITLTTSGGKIDIRGGTLDNAFVMVGHGGVTASGNSGAVDDVILVQAKGSVSLTAGNVDNSFVQIGNGGLNSTGSRSSRSLTVISEDGDVTLRGGTTTGAADDAYAQIGHGGTQVNTAASGEIRVEALKGTVALLAGSMAAIPAVNLNPGFAAIGHGGHRNTSAQSGQIVVLANKIDLNAGVSAEAYAQIGHGGGAHGAVGSHGTLSGDLYLNFDPLTGLASGGGDAISLRGGTANSAYAQVGHGGAFRGSVITGNLQIGAGAALNLIAGSGTGAYAQLGHGGAGSTGNRSGAISLRTAGNVSMVGGTSGENAYSQIGHGGAFGARTVVGILEGNLCLAIGGQLSMAGTAAGGVGTYTLIGHGGRHNESTKIGSISIVTGLSTPGGISLAGGSNGTVSRFAQIGHGGAAAFGNTSGDISVVADKGGSILLAGGGNNYSYTMIGHGDRVNSTGTRQGGLSVFADGNITATHVEARLAHLNSGTVSNYTAGSGGVGYQIVANGTASISDAALGGAAGVNTMVNAMIGNGPIRFALTNNIDITVNGGAALSPNPGHDLILLTGGNIKVNRGYQNLDSGDIVLVAGWNGTGTVTPAGNWGVQYGLSGTDYCAPLTSLIDTTGFTAAGAFGNNGRTITIGEGNQTSAVRVGTRTGETILAAHGIVLNASTTTSGAAAQVGFAGTGATTSGDLSLFANGGGLTLNSGTTSAYTQIGHGGLNAPNSNVTADIKITFAETGSLELNAGTGNFSYAQIGHGGTGSTGDYTGAITIDNARALALNASRSAAVATYRYAHIGHGGGQSTGNRSGAIEIEVMENLDLNGGGNGDNSYAQIGHGGARGSINALAVDLAGDICVKVGGKVTLAADTASDFGGTSTLIGHGGRNTLSTRSGDIRVVTGLLTQGGVTLSAGPGVAPSRFSQIGHAGTAPGGTTGTAAGDLFVVAEKGGSILLNGTTGSAHNYAMIGHGSLSSSLDSISGGLSVFADGSIVAADLRSRIGHSSAGTTMNNSTGASAAGYQIVSNGTNNISDAALGGAAGVNTMVNAMIGNGPIRLALTNNFNIAINAGAAINATPGEDFILLTGGNITMNRSYQNRNSGDVVLVAGWDGTSSGSSWAVNYGGGGTDYCDPKIILANIGGFNSCGSFGNNAKTITIGSTAQTSAVRVGTRTGTTILAAHGIVLNASTTTGSAASQIGFQGKGDAITGAITLSLRNGGLTLNGGTSNGYAQVGHGGTGATASTINAPISITFCAPGAVTLNSGSGLDAYTQIGHGGRNLGGAKTGAITIGGAASNTKAGAVSLLGGSFAGAYAFIGNGGLASSGTTNGNIWIESAGLVNLAAGSAFDSFTQIGHGGRDASGVFGIAAEKTVVIADGGIHLRAGTAVIDQYGAYSQIGNGGYAGGTTTAMGDIYLNFNPSTMLSAGGGSILLDGGASVQGAYAQVGHGGRNRNGNKSGQIVIGRADTVALTSQNQFGYTQIGHGGDGSTAGGNMGTASGSIRLLEVGEVSLRGGTGAAHTMIGHGGYQFGGTARGVAGDRIEIITSGDVKVEGGGVNSLVQIGHGGVTIGTTTFNTEIRLQVGGDLLVKGGTGGNSQAMIGHGGFGTTALPIAGLVQNSDITIDVVGDINVRSGTGSESPAQIGHGGYNSMPLVVVNSNIAINTDLSGTSNGNLSLISTSQNGYAQIGHGGSRSDANPDFGSKSGHITIGRVQHLTMSSGGATDAYTQIGHGGEGGNRLGVTGVISGNISAGILGNLSLSGGSGIDSYSQIGHGGDNTAYASSGSIVLTLGGLMDLAGGSGEDSYAQIGHGGNGALGTNSGSISVRHRSGSPALAFTLRGGTGIDAAAFIGHGGDDASGATRGHIEVHSNGRLDLLSGSNQDAYTLIGHGGHNNLANHGGIADEDSLENRILVSAQEGISLIGGNAGVRAFAKIGNGGYNTDGTIRGAVYVNYDPDSNVVTGAGAVVLQSGSAADAFTHIGSGGLGVSGAKSGDVVVAGDSVMVATGSGAGSFSLIGIGSGIAGDTSQQDGGLLTGNTKVIATSGDVKVDATLSGDQAFAKIGAGGLISGGSTTNLHRSDTTVVAAGALSIRSGSTSNSFAMIGLGGNATDGDKIGNIYVEAAAITLLSGSGAGASTLIGNGGGRTGGNRVNLGNTSGDVDVRAGAGGLSLEAGSAIYTFSQIGNLGLGGTANHSGQIRVNSAGGVSLRGGTTVTNTDAVIGHGVRGSAGNLQGDLWIHALGETLLVDQTGLAILGHAGTGATTGSTDFALITGTLNLAAASYGLTGAMARMAPNGSIDIGVLNGDLILKGTATNAAHGKDINLFATGDVIIGASVQNAGTGAVNAVAGWDGVTGLIAQIPAAGPPALLDLGLEISPLLLDDTTWGRAGGKVIVGGATGTTGAALGSAGGSTVVLGESVIVQGSETTAGGYALVGFAPTVGVAPSGSILVKALDGGILVHAGDRTNSLAQIGHRSLGTIVPSLGGDINLVSGGGLSLRGGSALQASAQIGHGGSSSTLSGMTGTISVLVATDLEAVSGTGSAAYAQVGHGGFFTSADMSGDIRVEAGGSIALRSLAPEKVAYAKMGHGDDARGNSLAFAGSGTRGGNIVVAAGGGFALEDALVGHRSSLSPATATVGETWIGVARNDPADPAEGNLEANSGSEFSGAEGIRFYLPRRENNQIAAGAVINGVSYGGSVADPWPVQRPDEYTRYLETATGTTEPAEHNDTLGHGLVPTVPGDYAFYYHLIVLGGTFPPLPIDPGNPTVPVAPGPSDPGTGPGSIDYLALMPEDRTFDDWLRDEEKQYTGWGSFAILYEGYPQYGLHGESIFNYGER